MMEMVQLEFGDARPRFCREAEGILWETHENVAFTRMERKETHRGPRAGEGNVSFTEDCDGD